MSNIERHISDLLMQHNCVVVPRLGAFVGSYQSASISNERNIIYPPYKEILFNKSLSHNDGLLIASFASRFKLSYGDVEIVVSDFVDATVLSLSKGESVTIGEVGVLKSDIAGNIFLVQNEAVNFLAGSFGMSAIHHEPFRQMNAIKTKENYSRVFVRMVANRRVATLAAASFALFLFTTTFDVSDIAHYQTGSLIPSSQVQIAVKESVVKESSAPIYELPETSLPAKEIVKVNEKSFYLIGASVVNRADADEIVNKFINDGFGNAKIIEVDGRFRVSVNHFESKAEALIAMNELRSSNKFKDVWVFKY